MLGEATDLYKRLIEECPEYVDAYLRLSYLARKRGNTQRALDYLEMARK